MRFAQLQLLHPAPLNSGSLRPNFSLNFLVGVKKGVYSVFLTVDVLRIGLGAISKGTCCETKTCTNYTSDVLGQELADRR